ncbi:MgtC/SapB family protein [Aggregicoccus sp. 17bor-14]|uniref:MgtC/SapB family protein n=1 Tax=Myxococcaceae TaxID=31 RepID=UPI00129C6A35|nr:MULTISPECIES: MgtC/SapB family protein [Myxococcaceae]MBF5045912.1 MgtC/SapB family protein [Simulacricoccus sp. 17bor-14]MRI91646.1 MgtC/SapB family protein [Aggregicoccus sp. 17bor-14]
MDEPNLHDALEILTRLLMATVVGALIGFERRRQRKAIGIGGMVLVALGSTSYMLVGQYLAKSDPAALSRTLQGLMQGIGFLGGAVIFRGGTDVRGIKTAAAVWITGASGLAIGTGYWVLGLTVGVATAVILFVTDLFPPRSPLPDAPTPLSPED